MAARVTRAKKKISAARIAYREPEAAELPDRLDAVLTVVHLLFTTGHGQLRGELADRAIELGRILAQLMPDEREVRGLLALMLLTDARRAARTYAAGSIVPLAEQDRSHWDAAAIAEGQALLTRTLGAGPVGPYQIQAAIAAVHDEATDDDQTDWPQILALYEVLAQVAPGPVVTLSRAVAMARVHGPRACLALLGTLDADERMAHTHRLEAVRAHLLERAGDPHAARQSYLRAARMTASLPEQRYLTRRAALLPKLPKATDPAGS